MLKNAQVSLEKNSSNKVSKYCLIVGECYRPGNATNKTLQRTQNAFHRSYDE